MEPESLFEPQGAVREGEGETEGQYAASSVGQSSSELSSPVIVELCEVEGEEMAREEKDDDSPRRKPLDEDCSDPELEELLNVSLNEFGKNVPPPTSLTNPAEVASPPHPTHPVRSDLPSPQGPPGLPGMEEFEEVFSEEFAIQAEEQLDQAMKMLASENPQLWQQLEAFTKQAGEESGEGGGEEKEGEGASALDAQLEETLQKLRQGVEQVESAGASGFNLPDMLGGLDLGNEDNEDQLMRMMEGMVNTLLSKEVLYPSLTDITKQYPEWLQSHKSELSPEDFTRYSNQFTIMTSICHEFEEEKDDDATAVKHARMERIMQHMQKLQQYGQPPQDLAGENYPQAGLAGAGLAPNLPDLQADKNCVVM